jgi:isoprenylcysteine carboxyl methyltransferase (ICMT) family protein YpbQ
MDYHQGQFVTRMVETPEVTKRLELFVRKQGENNYGKENQKIL